LAESAQILKRANLRAGPSAAAGWLADTLIAERERWALWLPVAFAGGIAAYFGLKAEPPVWPGALTAAVGLGAYLWFRRGRSAMAAVALLLVAAAAGFAAAQVRTVLVQAPILAKRIGPVWIVGQVESVEPRDVGVRLTLTHLDIARLAPSETPARVRIVDRVADHDVRPGDWVGVRSVLRPPPGPSAPGAFDFARQAYFEGIGGVGFSYGSARIIEAPAGAETTDPLFGSFGETWHGAWAGLRLDLARRITEALPGRRGAVAAALMTGERGAIAPADMAAMRDSGLAHLLAISGLHVGLVAGLLFLSLRLAMAAVPHLALNYPIKKWAACAAIAGAFAYLMLTGATIPTQRAFLMTALVLLAVTIDRSALTMRLVAWAAFAVLLAAPESLLSASFQMSFAAVVALIATYEFYRTWRGPGGRAHGPLMKIAGFLAGVAATSLVAGLATAPFALYHFNRIAWFGLAANMVAVPLTGLWIMPWALAAYALMPFGLEALALVPMGWGIEAMLQVAHAVATWPGATSTLPAMPVAGLVTLALGGVWLCLWRRPWRLAGLPVILIGLGSAAFVVPPDILVTGDGKLFGLRGLDGALAVSDENLHRFAADVWLRRAGEDTLEDWPAEDADGEQGALAWVSCDSLGCIYRAGGQVAALVRDSRALAEDCARTDLIVSREPVRRRSCRGPKWIVDRFDLWRGGAHAFWLAADGIRIESAAQARGARPWAPARRPSRTAGGS
jgi:competence protein ComEC